MGNKKELFNFLAQYSLLFPGQQSKEKIQAYTEFLSPFDIKIIRSVANVLVRKSEFFPTLKNFTDEIEGPQVNEEDYAIERADKILEIASNTSQYDRNIGNELSQAEKLVVRSFGGWDALTKLTYDQMGMVRSQLRKSVKAACREDFEKLIEYKSNKIMLE